MKRLLLALLILALALTPIIPAIGGQQSTYTDLTSLQSEHATLQGEHVTLQSEHTALGAEHTTLLSDNVTLKAEHAALVVEHASLSANHVTLQGEHTALAATHTTLQSEHAALVVEHAAIQTEVDKIDTAATLGLSGTADSLAYRVGEAERHFHGYERTFGAAVTPSGETHVADRVGPSVVAFQADAGNNTWGAWIQVLGSSDTPADVGMVKFDLHRLSFTTAERNATYFIQVAHGTSGAAGLAALTYTENVFVPATNQIDSGPVDIMMRRKVAGEKVWVRVMCLSQDTGTLDFYVVIHEYEG